MSGTRAAEEGVGAGVLPQVAGESLVSACGGHEALDLAVPRLVGSPEAEGSCHEAIVVG